MITSLGSVGFFDELWALLPLMGPRMSCTNIRQMSRMGLLKKQHNELLLLDIEGIDTFVLKVKLSLSNSREHDSLRSNLLLTVFWLASFQHFLSPLLPFLTICILCSYILRGSTKGLQGVLGGSKDLGHRAKYTISNINSPLSDQCLPR